MNPDTYMLTIMVGRGAVASALVKNTTPIPLPGDAFTFQDEGLAFVTRKVLSRTFSLTRDDKGPNIGVTVYLSEESV